MSRGREAGMTLIEVLVAISLLSILSVLGYKAFSALLLTRERLMEVSARWIDLSRTFAQLGETLDGAAAVQLLSTQEGQQLVLSLPAGPGGEAGEHIRYLAGPAGLQWTSSRYPRAAFPLLDGAYRTLWYVRLDDGRESMQWGPGAPGRPVALGMRVSGPLIGSVSRLWSLT